MKYSKYLIFSLLLFFPFFFSQASFIKTPILSDLNPNIKTFSEPFISGYTEKGTSVLVYIDGQYWDNAAISESNKVNNFYFFLNKLPSDGQHQVFLIARNMNGVMSPATKEISFSISHNLDTPKILRFENSDRLFILGQTENENFIDVVIDDKLFSSIFVPRNSNNTFSFVSTEIKEGSHVIYFRAHDNVGRQSNISTPTSFYYKASSMIEPPNTPGEKDAGPKELVKTKSPAISPVAQIDEVLVQGVDNIEEKTEGEGGELDEEKIIDEILDGQQTEEDEQTGAYNETGENQADLKWNIIIFLAFLLAVILWVVWVNREIVEEEKDKGKNKSN